MVADDDLDATVVALRAADVRGVWDPPTLPEICDELTAWLGDDHQWANASQAAWRSLIDDVVGGVEGFPDDVFASLRTRAILLEDLKDCRRLMRRDDSRADASLRTRLTSLAARLDELRTDAAVVATWRDLARRLDRPEQAVLAAQRLLGLLAWRGIDRTMARRMIEDELLGNWPRTGPVAPPSHRLRRATAALTRPRPTGHTVVWLRLLYAHLDGRSELAVGPNVSLYERRTLATRVAAASGDVPAEVRVQDAYRTFDTLLRGITDDDSDEPPIALARVDCAATTSELAVRQAELTAETLAALGVPRGSDPSLWQLDNSHVVFRDGSEVASHVGAKPHEPSRVSAMSARSDPTASVIAEMADEIGQRLPISGGALESASQLLLWLRDAQLAPDVARLVLCDRAIETVAGWAGVSSARRFVEEFLLHAWVHGRIRNAVSDVIFQLHYNDDSRYFPDSEWGKRREAVLNDPDIGFRMTDPGLSVSLPGVIRRASWIAEQTEPGSRANRRATELAWRVQTPSTALTWVDDLKAHGSRLEQRRSRTRNALVHGGPVSNATVLAVLPFAEFMANHAVADAINGVLAGSVLERFLEQQQRLRDVRHQLSMGARLDTALFWSAG